MLSERPASSLRPAQRWRRGVAVVSIGWLLAGCAATPGLEPGAGATAAVPAPPGPTAAPATGAPPAAALPTTPEPPPAAPPAPPAPAVVVPPPVPGPAEVMLAYADSLRNLSAAELAQEVGNVAEPGETAPRLMRLALALNMARTPINNIRAQVLLQRVLAQNSPEARALHPLARLVAAHVAEARRLDELLERQNQQLRDAQRRIEQLNERLEAVRAIERSLPSRPVPAPAPAAAPAAAPLPGAGGRP